MNRYEKQVADFFETLPGKRGVDIPEDVYDRIHPVANGITQPLWGRPPSPEQLQFLYENGHHDPDAIHEVYNQLPHPHAPAVNVGEYDGWKKAYKSWKEHAGK